MNTTSSRFKVASFPKSKLFGEYLFALLFLATIEMFWRKSQSEYWDFFGTFILLLGSSALLLKSNLGARFLDYLKQLKIRAQRFLETIELGLDFRPQEEKPLEYTKFEKASYILMGLFLICFSYGISLTHFLGHYLLNFSAVAYLACLSLVWCCTLVVIVTISFTGVSSAWESLCSRYPHVNRYLTLLATLFLTCGIVFIFHYTLNLYVSIGLVLCLGLLPFFLLAGQEEERPYLLYGIKGKSNIKSLALIRWAKSYLVFSGFFVALWGTLLLSSLFYNTTDTRYQITQFMGKVFLWFWTIQRSYLLYHLFYWKKQAPTPVSQKVLWINKNGPLQPLPETSQELKEKGWKVVQHHKLPKKDEADLQLGFAHIPESLSQVPSLNITQEQLNMKSSATFAIERRERIQKKRQFLRGMKKLFKIGSAKKNKSGDGYILGPWWWLTQGLRRNEEEFSFHNYFNTFVGPHFQLLYSKPVRQYIYNLFRSVDVDFIYMEDGITFNNFRKVMDIILEYYETQESGTPIEERHFAQLTGVKVIIDEFGRDEKKYNQHVKYQEPEFVGNSRARIMQIFKDRGDNEKEEIPPDVSFEDDYEWLRDSMDKMFPTSSTLGR